MKFKDLPLGEGFRYNNKLFIKVNLPVPAALNVIDGKGKIVRFNEEDNVEKVILDLSITKCY